MKEILARLFGKGTGVAGDVDVITAGGDEVTFTGVLAGSFIPVQVTRVKATSTTASGIIALW